jgi:hypothetical protein
MVGAQSLITPRSTMGTRLKRKEADEWYYRWSYWRGRECKDREQAIAYNSSPAPDTNDNATVRQKLPYWPWGRFSDNAVSLIVLHMRGDPVG